MSRLTWTCFHTVRRRTSCWPAARSCSLPSRWPSACSGPRSRCGACLEHTATVRLQQGHTSSKVNFPFLECIHGWGWRSYSNMPWLHWLTGFAASVSVGGLGALEGEDTCQAVCWTWTACGELCVDTLTGSQSRGLKGGQVVLVSLVTSCPLIFSQVYTIHLSLGRTRVSLTCNQQEQQKLGHIFSRDHPLSFLAHKQTLIGLNTTTLLQERTDQELTPSNVMNVILIGSAILF